MVSEKLGFPTLKETPETNSEERLLLDQLGKKLITDGWLSALCLNGHYFFRPDAQNKRCGLYDCDGYIFLHSHQERNYREVLDIESVIGQAFRKEGYDHMPAMPVNQTRGQTYFVVAGVQTLEQALQNELPLPTKPFYVAQPSIRETPISLIEQGGFSNSFVNIATVHANARFDEHLQNLEKWLQILDQVGIRQDKITLTARVVPDNWGKGEMRGLVTDINYMGLQIGDAVFWQKFPQDNRPAVNISDCGFGLERIAWAINGGSYFDAINAGEHNSFRADALRTAVLMFISGVNPYADRVRQRTDRFRQLISTVRKEASQIPIDSLIANYFDFWIAFINSNAPGSLENAKSYTIHKIKGLVETERW